jgi:hypothetical protein
MSETIERPSLSIDPNAWAYMFVRRSSAEPGFALDEDAVAEWFGEVIQAAYARGLKDGAMS